MVKSLLILFKRSDYELYANIVQLNYHKRKHCIMNIKEIREILNLIMDKKQVTKIRIDFNVGYAVFEVKEDIES